MTNREWLNGLSDEEMAKVLSTIPCEYFALADEGRCYLNRRCEECLFTWLKAEREEAKNDERRAN